MAQEVREYLAEMGFTKLDEIVGRTDLIELKPRIEGSKASTMDFSRLLHRVNNNAALFHKTNQIHNISTVLDVEMIKAAKDSIDNQKEVTLNYSIKNTDRAVGTMLSGTIATKYGEAGLPDETINVRFKGSAGQSFGAFLVKVSISNSRVRPTTISARV